MRTKHKTQIHFAGMTDYSVGMSNIYYLGLLLCLLLCLPLVLVRCAASKYLRGEWDLK